MKKRKSATTGRDFTRVKRKVGKTAPLPSNATQTKFSYRSIHVPSQRLQEHSSSAASSSSSRLALHIAQLQQHFTKLTHHNGTVRKDALSQVQSLLSSQPPLLTLQLSSLISHTAEAVLDTERPVRLALLALYEQVVFPFLSASLISPYLRVVLGYVCSGLCHIEPSVRRTSLSFLSLLMRLYPQLVWPYHAQLLPAFVSLLADRISHAADASQQQQTQRAWSEKDKHSSAAQRAVSVAKASILFRLQLLQCLDRFLSLCPAVAADAVAVVSSSVELNNEAADSPHQQSSEAAAYSASLQSLLCPSHAALAASFPSTSVSTLPGCNSVGDHHSDVSALTQLAVSRAVPVKYQRKSGGSHGKKAAITTTDDVALLKAMTSGAATSASSTPLSSPIFISISASSAALSNGHSSSPLQSFMSQSMPLLVEYWLEALGGEQAQANRSLFTANSLHCAEAVVSSLHTLCVIAAQPPFSSSPSPLLPFLPSLSAHLFARFPLPLDDADAVSGINIHIAHIMAHFLPSDADDGTAGSVQGSRSSRREEEKARLVDDWTTALLHFLGTAFHCASASGGSSKPELTTAAVHSRKRRGEWRAAEMEAASLPAAQVVQVLPVLRVLLDRVSEERRLWLLEAFTSYYLTLHPLSPAKLRCLALITQLLQPPEGVVWLQQPIGHVWIGSIPNYLLQLGARMPASSQCALQLLQLCVRCYHPQLADLELLMPALLSFFSSTLFTLPDSLQCLSLSLLYYLRAFPPPLLSCFAAAFSRPSLPASTRRLLLQMVASHRSTLGVGLYASFLLSCLSSHHTADDTNTDSSEDSSFTCHPHAELVLERVRELAADESLSASKALQSLQSAELLLLLLTPTLLSLVAAASSPYPSPSGSRQLQLNAPNLLAVIQTLSAAVQRTLPDAASPSSTSPSLLPPVLILPVSQLLLDFLLSFQSRLRLLPASSIFAYSSVNESGESSTSEPFKLCLQLLLHCPSLLLPFLHQLVVAAAEAAQASFVCELLTALLRCRELRDWLAESAVADAVLAGWRAVSAESVGLSSAALSPLRSLCHLLYGQRLDAAINVL